MEIKYIVEAIGGRQLPRTICQHRKTLLGNVYVGSMSCKMCQYNAGIDIYKHIVNCTKETKKEPKKVERKAKKPDKKRLTKAKKTLKDAEQRTGARAVKKK